jgi:hypothetical protein
MLASATNAALKERAVVCRALEAVMAAAPRGSSWIRRSIPRGVSSCSRTRSSRLAWPISGQMGRGERGPTAGAGKEGNRAED